MHKFAHETLTLPPLLLKEVTMTVVQKALESSKYCSQGNHGLLGKSSCSVSEEAARQSAFALPSSCQSWMLTTGTWWLRNGTIYLLKSCQPCGSKEGRGTPSLCSGPVPLEGSQLGPALDSQAASISSSAGLSPGAAEESLNVTVQHTAN